MTPDRFTFISELLRERSGLVLTTEKTYLLESRLTPIARRAEVSNIDALIDLMKAKRDVNLIEEVVDAMTTNESFFFRDIKPFDLFRDHVLPPLLEARASKKSFRIWCAAASSGQEPYSIAMTLLEQKAKLAGWNYEIVGTDISWSILDKAEKGVYSQFEVQRGMPITLLVKYFEQQGETWRIKPEVREKIKFKFFNLLESPASLGKFDVVFCRNVLIYFDQKTKGEVLERIAALMPPDGMLFLGGAETVLGVSNAFKPVPNQRGVYALT
jgi:chemotaxis protein methyltransferase CheR